jgi:hypothetical protein
MPSLTAQCHGVFIDRVTLIWGCLRIRSIPAVYQHQHRQPHSLTSFDHSLVHFISSSSSALYLWQLQSLSYVLFPSFLDFCALFLTLSMTWWIFYYYIDDALIRSSCFIPFTADLTEIKSVIHHSVLSCFLWYTAFFLVALHYLVSVLALYRKALVMVTLYLYL